MINYTTQSSSALQHISLLRKVISQKLTGTIHFQFEQKDPVGIEFSKGDMVGVNDVKGNEALIVEQLRIVLQTPVIRYAWEEKAHEAKFGWTSPAIGLAKALYSLPLNTERLIAYKTSFNKLPPLTLKPKPIHRYSFGDETEYQYLYQLSLMSPYFKVADFFADTATEDVLLRHVRTILFAFLLGYLVPAAGGAAPSSNRVSMAAKIMQRFRRG